MSKLNNENFTLIARQGLAANIRAAITYSSKGELAYTTDTKEFYISDGTNFNPLGVVQLFNHFADQGNGTTVETDLYSDTIPAGQLAINGDKLSGMYGGIFVASATATREIKVYFGGSAIFDSGALSISAGSDAWAVYAEVIRDSSTSVRCIVTMSTTGAAINAYCAYTSVTGLTLTNTQILKITGQAAAVGAASNDIVAKQSYVEFRGAA